MHDREYERNAPQPGIPGVPIRTDAPGLIETSGPASATGFTTVMVTESVATAPSESWAVTVNVVVAGATTSVCAVVALSMQSEQAGFADQA